MNKEELLQYILNRKYYCPYCQELQKEVKEKGLDEINNYEGMICASITDMQLRLYEIETGNTVTMLDEKCWKDLFA